MGLSFSSRACISPEIISKKTVIAMFPEDSGTRTWLNKLTDDQWDITSFDSERRVVCIDVEANNGLRHISLTLPLLSVSKLR